MLPESQSFDRVLSSMCTKPHPEAVEAATRYIATNPGDPSTFPAVSRLEDRAISILGEITGLSSPNGYITAGGTEANIQALRIARNAHPVQNPNVVVPESAHFSFQKAAHILDLELRTVPVDDQYRADPKQISRHTDHSTVCIVGIAGNTEYGRVDPLSQLADIAYDYQAIFHIDAAWGGFALPFTEHDWNFSDIPVDTMTIDPHKMGKAPIPAGGLLVRSEELLDSLAIETPYLESTSQTTLTGTRSGAGVAGTVAALEKLWPSKYRSIVNQQQENAKWTASALSDRGLDVVPPELPLVAVDLPNNVFNELKSSGWRISRTSRGELRIVFMPHVSRDMIREFLTDLDRLLPKTTSN